MLSTTQFCTIKSQNFVLMERKNKDSLTIRESEPKVQGGKKSKAVQIFTPMCIFHHLRLEKVGSDF